MHAQLIRLDMYIVAIPEQPPDLTGQLSVEFRIDADYHLRCGLLQDTTGSHPHTVQHTLPGFVKLPVVCIQVT